MLPRMAVKDVRGMKCFITGAASGIGRATAIAAAQRGAELFLTDIQDEPLERVAGEIHASGGKVSVAAPADVSDHAAVVALAETIHRGHGSMDVVMNIAGISTWGTVDRLTHEHWRRQVDVNLMGPIHVIECFIPAMIEAGRGGQLLNVSSSAGLFGFPWHSAYSAAKFGLRGISEVLRFDLRRHDIGVTLVCPGAVSTGLVETVEIVGVNREDPRVKKLVHRFEKRAKSHESADESILTGMRKCRFIVYTSNDIRFGHFVQRKFAKPYELAMQVMNDRLSAVAEKASKP
jgi:NAD(P)-dependent dehydrogenase (short-subunit alcohol dehydrogenase family)